MLPRSWRAKSCSPPLMPAPHPSPSGVKGAGEVVLVGVAPAITNAVYYATSVRARHLPFRIEDLI